MALLREQDDFGELLRTASQQLNMPAGLAEKDYWLTQVMRLLAREHYDQFILKGGTSLSKGWGLLNRFSEDVDLLLLPGAADDEEGVVAGMIESIRDTVRTLDVDVTDGDGKEGVVQVLYVAYPANEEPAPGLDPEVRIDYGVGGGPMPQADVRINTLVGNALERRDIDPRGFEDLAPFVVTVLHPARTLLEKLILVHSLSVRLQAGGHVRSREARHYYDIHHLLDEERSPAPQWIADFGDIGGIVEDCLRVTRRFYGGDDIPDPPRPLSTSPAITGEDVLATVRQRYAKMVAALGFPGREHPQLDDVLRRVREYDGIL